MVCHFFYVLLMEFVDLYSFCKWVLFIGSNGIWGFCVDELKLGFLWAFYSFSFLNLGLDSHG